MSSRRNHLTLRSPLVVGSKKTESLLEICSSTITLGNSISVHILEYLSVVKAPPSGFKELAVEFLETSHALFATRAGLVGVVRLGSTLDDATSTGLEARSHQTKSAFVLCGQMVDRLLNSEKKHAFGRKLRKMFAEGDMDKIKVSMTQSRIGLEAYPLPSTFNDAKLEAGQCVGYQALAAVLERKDPTRGNQTLHTRQVSNLLAALPPPPPSPSGPLPLPPIAQDIYASPSTPSKFSPWTPGFSDGSFTQVASDRNSAVRGDNISEVTSIRSTGHEYGDRNSLQQQPSIRAKFDPSKAPNSVMPNGETPFTHAINKTTPMSLIERMLLNGAKVDQKNSHGETALFKAIACERHDLVNRLLSAGADPNLPGPKILLWPAVHQPQMLEALLTAGASLARAPGVLELATSINSIEAVEILLRHGVDINAKKDGIYTPLCSAIRDDRGELVEILLKANADPNLPALEYPTFKAVHYHRTHFLPSLIAAGADLNNPKGLIEYAVSHENKESLLFLLSQNVDIDINARNPAGHTALTTAIRDDRLEFIDILLSHGADPGVRGQDWPISMAVNRPDILAKLLPHIPTSRITKGVLEMAVVANQLPSVKLLIEKGISVEDKNAGVFSPLTTSIRENRKDIFRYLIDVARADPNAPGEHLPIIKAIRRHREEDLSYIEHLLAKGADVNLLYRGWNAVLQAVENGDLKILRLLAGKGTLDLGVCDESGRSVGEILRERGLGEEEVILLGGREVDC